MRSEARLYTRQKTHLFKVGNKLDSNKFFKGFRKKRKIRNWSVVETSI